MTKKIVLFNAAPGSGKDAAAKHCAGVFGGKQMEFKAKLFEIALAVAPIEDSAWWCTYNNRDNQHWNTKETPLQELGGLSQRQFLIKISEEFVKPIFGNQYFGEMAARAVDQSNQTNFFFSDSGFMDEVYPLIDLVGRENVFLVRVNRPGYTFKGDSRNYLDPILFVHSAVIENDGSEELFLKRVQHVVGNFLHPENEWEATGD